MKAAALLQAYARDVRKRMQDKEEAERKLLGAPVETCVESTSASGARQFFTKSFLGDDAADLARSSGEEPASPRHRAGVASMAWRTTRQFSTNAP